MKLALLAIQNRNMLFNLIKSDFKIRYLGSHLGVVWAFIQPLMMVAVYWFVFSQGFGVSSVSKTPFLLWLFAGIIPWFLLNDAIITASHSITSQAFLVKKVLFEVKLLPLVKVGSSVLVNLGFWFFMLILCFCYHYYPTLLWLQLIYYLFCTIVISLVLGLLFSAIMPFASDMGQIITIMFQILFWVTPVTWNQNLLQGNWLLMVQLNPFAYIVNGMRDTFIAHTPFWSNPGSMAYFWAFTLVIYWLSNHTFNKLRPHFADVL